MNRLFLLTAAFLCAGPGLLNAQKSDGLSLDDTMAATKTAPIEFPKTSATSAQFTIERERWAKRVFLPLIRTELGEKAKETDVAETIDKLVSFWATFDHQRMSSAGQFNQMWWDWRAESMGLDAKPLATKAAALVPVDAPMPVLQYFIWYALDISRQRADADARGKSALKSLNSKKVAPLLGAALAIRRLVSSQSTDAQADLEIMRDLLPLALTKKSCPPEDVPFVVDLLVVRINAQELGSKSVGLAELYKESELPEWARLTLAGFAETYAVQPLSPKHPIAAKQYKAAGELLSAAWKANPARPEAATGMIKVAKTGNAPGGESIRVWFDRATAAQCDYLKAYTTMVEALDPTFGGDYLKLLAFGVACARTERYDTGIPEYLPISIGTIVRQVPDWRPMVRQAEVSQRLVQTLNKRIELTPDGELKRHYRGLAFLMGWMAGDFKTAATNVETMKESSGRYTWPSPTNHMMVNMLLDSNRILDESLSLGLDGPGVLAAHQAWEKGEFAKALELAEAEMKNKPKSFDWLRVLIQDSRFAVGFKAGKWTLLPTDRGTWFKDGMGGEFRQDNVLAIATTDSFWPKRLLRSNLGSHFEVRGEVRLPQGDVASSGFMLSIGNPDEFCARTSSDWLVLRVSTKDRKNSEIRIGPKQAGFNIPARPGPELSGDVVKFRLMRKGGKISWWVNDTAILEDQNIPEELPDGPCAFGIGGTTNKGKEPIIFEKLEARRLIDAG